jgi:hypothetical protein
LEKPYIASLFHPGQGHQVHLGFAIVSSDLRAIARRSW